MEPTTRYIERDGCTLAYQVFGPGPATWSSCSRSAATSTCCGPIPTSMPCSTAGFPVPVRLDAAPRVRPLRSHLLRADGGAAGRRPPRRHGRGRPGQATLPARSRPVPRPRRSPRPFPIASATCAPAPLRHRYPSGVGGEGGCPRRSSRRLLAAWHEAFDEWGPGDSLRNWDAGRPPGTTVASFGMMERCSAPRSTAVGLSRLDRRAGRRRHLQVRGRAHAGARHPAQHPAGVGTRATWPSSSRARST